MNQLFLFILLIGVFTLVMLLLRMAFVRLTKKELQVFVEDSDSLDHLLESHDIEQTYPPKEQPIHDRKNRLT